MPFRQLQTEMHNLSKIFRFPEISFTSIYRRSRKIVPEIENDNNGVLAAIDSSGFKVTLRGDYLGNKWHKIRKGWIKLHAVININNFQIMDYSITDGCKRRSGSVQKRRFGIDPLYIYFSSFYHSLLSFWKEFLFLSLIL